MNDLDLIYLRHNRKGNAGEIPRHPIRYYELTMVLKGKLEYYVNGEEAILQTGDAVFIPHSAVRYRRDLPEDVDYISFNFDTRTPPALPVVIRNCVNRQVQHIVAILDELERKTYLDNQEKMVHLLSCLLLVLEDHVRTARYNPVTMKIMRYLHQNYAQRITLEQIGKLTAFSPVYCDTLFRQEVGRSIIDYLIDTRIDEAKKLLMEGSVSIGRIGELTGFQDSNYFSRVFKKRTGDTPSGYRNRLGDR